MKHITLGIAVIAIVAFMFCATPAVRAEEVITFKPSTVSVLKDRNGNDYVRMIWGRTAELNGVQYSTGSTVNAYGEMVTAAKQIKPGQEITAVVQKRDYQGSTYYTVLGLKPTAAKKQ